MSNQSNVEKTLDEHMDDFLMDVVLLIGGEFYDYDTKHEAKAKLEALIASEVKKAEDKVRIDEMNIWYDDLSDTKANDRLRNRYDMISERIARSQRVATLTQEKNNG